MQTHTPRLRELTLSYRVRRDSDGHPLHTGVIVLSAADAVPVLTAILADQPAEVFGVLCLSTKRRVIGYHEVSRGQLDATIVHPREVFKVAILANASAIIVAHNHPSGDPTPSIDDLQLTRRLVDAGELLGISVLDHLVIGEGSYVSLRASGHW